VPWTPPLIIVSVVVAAKMLTVTGPGDRPPARYSPTTLVIGAARTAALRPSGTAVSTMTDAPTTGSPRSSITVPEMIAPFDIVTTRSGAGPRTVTVVFA